jgi:hypothetical protein
LPTSGALRRSKAKHSLIWAMQVRLDSQNGVKARRWFERWSMKKREVGAHCWRRQSPQRGDRWYHGNCEGANRPGSLCLGKKSVRRPLSFAAGMTGRHHGASTLLRHVVAALSLRRSHGRTRKDTSYGWRERPQKGNRQQCECSDPNHPHNCTASLITRNKDTTSSHDVSPPLRTTAVTMITALRLTETNQPNPPHEIDRTVWQAFFLGETPCP